MKNLSIFLSAALVLALSSCGMNNNTVKNSTDTAPATATVDSTAEKGLFAKMSMKDTVRAGEPAELKFIVYNNADTAQHFCKWHSPFEPFISKYLDIKSTSGEEVNYKGAMAKRVMPAPPSSYITVNSKDSVSTIVDLLKGYDISKPGQYSITYVGQNMSGLIVKDSISFIYTNK